MDLNYIKFLFNVVYWFFDSFWIGNFIGLILILLMILNIVFVIFILVFVFKNLNNLK